MNKLILLSILIFISIKNDSYAQNKMNSLKNISNCQLINPSSKLELKEIDFLIYMLEEEKLIRDVNKGFFEKYNHQIFKNAFQSHQAQISQIECLLKHYNIKYSINEREGLFTNLNIQQYYNDFYNQGNLSLILALKGSITLEELNVFDLGEYMNFTKNTAILEIFKHLSCLSKNHLRNFTKELLTKNENYMSKYITDKEYKKIIKQKNKSCSMNTTPTQPGQGQGKGKGSGMGSGQGKGKGKGMNY